MFTLITMPSPSTMLTDIGAWTSPVFNELMPIAVYVIGVALAFGIVAWLISAFGGLFHHKS